MKYSFFAESAAVLTLVKKKKNGEFYVAMASEVAPLSLKQNLWTSHAQNESDEQEEPYDCVG